MFSILAWPVPAGECRESHVPPGSSHRVVMIVDSGSNPFEMGVATELFGLRRPELGDRPWYSFTLCALGPVRMNHVFFTLTGVPDLGEVDGADTVIVSNRPDSRVRPPEPLLDGLRATTHWQWVDLSATGSRG